MDHQWRDRGLLDQEFFGDGQRNAQQQQRPPAEPVLADIAWAMTAPPPHTAISIGNTKIDVKRVAPGSTSKNFGARNASSSAGAMRLSRPRRWSVIALAIPDSSNLSREYLSTKINANAFDEFNRLHRELATAMIVFHEAGARRLGMTAAERKCAGLIVELGETTPKQLAEMTGLTTGAITGIVDRLERAGYARRKPNPKDRRSVSDPAAKFERLAKETQPIFAALTEAMTSSPVAIRPNNMRSSSSISRTRSPFSAIRRRKWKHRLGLDPAHACLKCAAIRTGGSRGQPRSEATHPEKTMGFRCGIVGLPNVGKSTLFNALTETAAAQAANYPFCTIEPNVGRVAVPDARLDKIRAIAKSAQEIETQIEFVDIAGLVRGASQGEGLGNQFLANIREVDAIVHVLRCFEGGDVTHVEGRVDPIADAETVETELMLADLDSLERRVPNLVKKAQQGDKEAKIEASVLGQALELLRASKPARLTKPKDHEEEKALQRAQLLTAKPVLYVCNVDEGDAANGNALSQRVFEKAAAEGAKAVVVSAAIEAEIATLPAEERDAFLADLGLHETGLTRVIRAGYELLGLITFFTAGPKEARAWTVHAGAKAPEAAGEIHTDFERGFIRAETIAYDDYVSCGGEAGARDAGKLRSEGKDYVVQDGDVMLFRFNV